jgi:alanine racemase
MNRYSIEHIAALTGGTVIGRGDIEVSRMLVDSRTTSVSPSFLFIALKGDRHNGHDFITGLYARGIRAFLVSEISETFNTLHDAGFVEVKDTLHAMQELARRHRAQYDCPVVGITGSNGKTIIKEWLFHCLADSYAITRSPKSYNSQVGVALSLWLMDDATRLGIFEAGISRPGEMASLQRMIRPGIGIFANIGEAHQENFNSLEQKTAEKLMLFQGCDTLIYCRDHSMIHHCIVQTPVFSGKLFTWSFTSRADLEVTAIDMNHGRTRFSARYGNQVFDVDIPFADKASLENAIHCLCLMLLLEIDPLSIRQKLADLPPVAMRLEQKAAMHGCTLINDTYNSDINSLSIALELLNRQTQHAGKTLILSDILQSGKTLGELYGRVAGMVQEQGISRIIGIGRDLNTCRDLFTMPGTFFNTTEDFIESGEIDNFQDEAILLKGSRRFEFEKIAALLELKKHTTRIEVNIDALVHNLNYFRSLLKPGTRTMVMVKALSYGSGRHEIASVLQYQRVDYLGVAFADEGIGLRQAGIELPIIVMNPEPESFDAMIRYRLEPEIYSFRILDMFSKALLRNQEIDYPVHVKIDTGMHRLGFQESEIPLLCHELTRLQSVKVSSVFSHLAASDEWVHDAFTEGQVQVFTQVSERIAEALGYPVIRHLLNTSGIERFPHAMFDMVRLGIGLYGISTVGHGKLRNVSTLRSTILQIKPVYPGDTVGYGRKGIIQKPSTIAIVPVGYADGLNRKLSNGTGEFVVNGSRVPIVGNICMDMTMIDITGTNACEGDEVVIFGEENPITCMAEKLDTIPYEILTGVSERVKRVYYHA